MGWSPLTPLQPCRRLPKKNTKHDPIVKRFPNHHHQTERILITNPLTTRVTNLHVAVNPSTEKKLP